MNTFGKWLAALLVLANVGLWLWATGIRPAGTPAVEGARPPLNADQMVLPDEPGATPVPRAAATAPAACYRLGPFPDEAAAEAAGARLTATVPAHDRRAEEQTVVTGYRVYLPPLPTRAAAEKKRRELARLGFKDSSVLQEEGGQNAISLGLFTVEANARKRLQALAARKVEAQMQTLTQTRRVHWLAFGPPLSPDVLARLGQTDWGGAEMKLEQVTCPAAP